IDFSNAHGLHCLWPQRAPRSYLYPTDAPLRDVLLRLNWTDVRNDISMRSPMYCLLSISSDGRAFLSVCRSRANIHLHRGYPMESLAVLFQPVPLSERSIPRYPLLCSDNLLFGLYRLQSHAYFLSNAGFLDGNGSHLKPPSFYRDGF